MFLLSNILIFSYAQLFFGEIISRFLKRPTSDFRLPTCDFWVPTSDFRLPSSDFRLPTSDFRLPTSDFRLPTFTGGGGQTLPVQCLRAIPRSRDFSSPIFFVARLDFPSPPLSAPGSPRMCLPIFVRRVSQVGAKNYHCTLLHIVLMVFLLSILINYFPLNYLPLNCQ